MVNRMGQIQRMHFVGIGGIGMSGIAEVLLNQGYLVSGSDLREGTATTRLKRLGAKIHIGHRATNIEGAEVIVVSSAIDRTNPEISSALEARIPVIPRAQMLAELMRFKFGIAVSGTHGKTTTTSIAASVLAEAGLDPTYIIGGKLNQVGTNASLGQSEYMVAEADESDASFLVLKPMIAVVTNIDVDHMSTYGGDFERLKQTFVQFLQNLPFYGLIIANNDDPVLTGLLSHVGRTFLTYAIESESDYRAMDIISDGLRTHFNVRRPNAGSLRITLPMPGRHNVLNALAVIALADHLGVNDDSLVAALSNFQGVDRRFQLAGFVHKKERKIPVIDDYGHHPKELQVTFDAVRAAYPNRRLVSVFQPHRYTRTQELFDEFVTVLNRADELVLMPVYAAGEAPIVGAGAKDLAQSIRRLGQCRPYVEAEFEQVIERVDALVEPNDVVLIQGAGSIGRLPSELITTLGGSR